MATRTGKFTPEDEGKRVVAPNGDVVGEVVHTENGTAFVRPQPELVVGYGSRIAGCWDGVDAVALDESKVTTDADGRIRIKPDERTEPGTVRNAE